MIKTKKPPETEKAAEKLVCESCGAEFSCGANVGKCWCFDVEVKPETLTTLRENFKRCLCEDCLSAANNNQVEFWR